MIGGKEGGALDYKDLMIPTTFSLVNRTTPPLSLGVSVGRRGLEKNPF